LHGTLLFSSLATDTLSLSSIQQAQKLSRPNHDKNTTNGQHEKTKTKRTQVQTTLQKQPSNAQIQRKNQGFDSYTCTLLLRHRPLMLRDHFWLEKSSEPTSS
jgi:hypothetical protein